MVGVSYLFTYNMYYTEPSEAAVQFRVFTVVAALAVINIILINSHTVSVVEDSCILLCDAV
jgi:hypothetical protein